MFLYMSYEKWVMVCLLVVKGLLNKVYCDSLNIYAKPSKMWTTLLTIPCRKPFKHKLAHSCTYILVDICED